MLTTYHVLDAVGLVLYICKDPNLYESIVNKQYETLAHQILVRE